MALCRQWQQKIPMLVQTLETAAQETSTHGEVIGPMSTVAITSMLFAFNPVLVINVGLAT